MYSTYLAKAVAGFILKNIETILLNHHTYKNKTAGMTTKQKQMTLAMAEFIRRFEQHILPERFTKIRTYGYLSNRNRQRRINDVLQKMHLPFHKEPVTIPIRVRMLEQFGIDITECPCCKNKTLQLLKIFYPCLSGRQACTRHPVAKHADDG